MIPKIGLVGVNGFGRLYLNFLSKLAEEGKIIFSGAVVRSPAKSAEAIEILEKHQVRIFPDASAMYDALPELDLVCLPTGIEFHEPMTLEALGRNLNVVVEKPLAGTLASAERIIAADRKSDCFVAVGFQHIYARAIQHFKREILSGKYGRVLSAAVQGVWPRDRAYYTRNDWAGRLVSPSGVKVCDSPVNNAFAHYLNLLLFVTGPEFDRSAEVVKVESELYRAREIESFDTCAIRWTTAAGVKILTLLSHSSFENINPFIEIKCEKGTFSWKQDEVWQIRDAAGSIVESGNVPAPWDQMFADLIARTGDPEVFICTPEIAARHTAAIEMLHQSPVIRNVREELVEVREPEGLYAIRDLVAIFQKSFENGKLPAENGFRLA